VVWIAYLSRGGQGKQRRAANVEVKGSLSRDATLLHPPDRGSTHLQIREDGDGVVVLLLDGPDHVHQVCFLLVLTVREVQSEYVST
jgi:hypothetical protein